MAAQDTTPKMRPDEQKALDECVKLVKGSNLSVEDIIKYVWKAGRQYTIAAYVEAARRVARS